MKRIALIALIAAGFSATNVLADTCTTSANGLVSTCDNGSESQSLPVYPTGEMPRDSNTTALVDKVNYLDVSSSEAHDRLNHDNDRLEAHKKSIGNLYKTKVDTATFEADQKRQDDSLNKVDQVAESAQINSNTAITSSADAKSTASTAKAMAGNAQGTADYAVNETQKLWADKASAQNVEELRGAHIEETQERIKNDAMTNQRIDELNNGLAQADSNSREYADNAKQQANAYTDKEVAAVKRQVKQVKREARGGVAGAAAMANIPTAREIGHMNIGAGTGFYKDTSAIAVGGSYRFNSNVTIKASVSTTGRDTVAGAGASYEF